MAPEPTVAQLQRELAQAREALQREIALREEGERLAAEHAADLVEFLDNAAEGIHRVGPDGSILWANKAELAMLGYAQDQYVGRHIADFHADQPVIDEILRKLLAGETLYDHPARLRCADGSIRQVLIHSNGYFVDGQLRYTRCFTRDASERHERDLALAQLREAHQEREAILRELTEANRNKDQFLAMLGHELRNPLAPVVMALEIMERHGDGATAPQRAVMHRQVGHLVRLVDDLLDIARVTQGKVALQAGHVRLADAVGSAVEIASAEVRRRDHALQVHADPALIVRGDAVRLAQVVANLLVNAARYTPRGGAIRLDAVRAGDATARISVADNGRGMAPEELRQAFDLFYQGERGIDRAEGGLGVGLALARRLVELHGGRIEAYSGGPGTGSEFVVHLPLDLDAARPPAAEGPHAAGQGTRRSVLLVDDNVDAAATLAMLLTQHGHAVQVRNDPAAALVLLQTLRPDVAVLDIGLPGMSGYELARRMRATPGGAHCRLIALSGYGQPADIARSAAAGFERHFVKPVQPDVLLALIDAGTEPQA
ncbi:PAS domain S-box-containing protein [Pseudoduganella lurida]|uniref:histidine kinase n=1 Tax=Pseudoduganella lurida TaxID=1036180 RepID=A0A562RCU4_9BURK|nr:ATP-binding protein [Pseudoduganella lurida]TWI66384.1 PAS domain S-box-containing protein [Pseudoduganella lurida]